MFLAKMNPIQTCVKVYTNSDPGGTKDLASVYSS